MDNFNIIDINKTNLEINSIKFPVIFLFRLLSLVDDLDDTTISIILRIFLKNHIETALSVNIKKLFSETVNESSKTWAVLVDFYRLINTKITIVFVLKKWHIIYTNPIFWKLSIRDQCIFLIEMREHFMSAYDCSKKGIPFHLKIAGILKDPKANRFEIITNAKDRLITVLNIFGEKLFESLEIPLIVASDFDKLTDDNIINYIAVIYDKFSELLNQTIKLFELYNIACIKLDNLLNPIILDINPLDIELEITNDEINMFCGN